MSGLGLNTVEIFLPSSGTSCTLPMLPEFRYLHTVDNHILCGGYASGSGTEDSCLQWSPDTGTWDELLTLDVGRSRHVSWTPANGIGTYLMGGSGGTRTTTLTASDGSQVPGFPLEHNTL